MNTRMASRKDYQWMAWALQGAQIFSTCGKRQYMAIIVDEHGHVLATGYNGGPRGFEHCKDGGCPRFQQGSAPGSSYDNCIAIHAEQNALLHSDYTSRFSGARGATMYVNGPPCYTCAKLIANGGISRLVYIPDESYAAWPEVEAFLRRAGVRLVEIDRDQVVERHGV